MFVARCIFQANFLYLLGISPHHSRSCALKSAACGAWWNSSLENCTEPWPVDSKKQQQREKKKTVHINILLEVHSMEIMAHEHLERALRIRRSAVCWALYAKRWNNTEIFMLRSLQFGFHVLKRAFIALRKVKSFDD